MHGPGTIFHGRNLDYNFPGLPNVTYTATFTNNGTVEYMGTAFVGTSDGVWHPLRRCSIATS